MGAIARGSGGGGGPPRRRLGRQPQQWSLSYEEALRNELRRGIEVVQSGESVAGATSFAHGQGRHGVF